MGLYDAESINAVRRAQMPCPAGGRSPSVARGHGGASQLHRYEANKANLAMLNERVGIFCDDTRDAIKGGCFDAREPGYVEGKPGSFWDIGGAVAAWCRSDRLPPHAPSQIVSYVSAHDNFTLWDKLLCVRYAQILFLLCSCLPLVRLLSCRPSLLGTLTECMALSVVRRLLPAAPFYKLLLLFLFLRCFPFWVRTGKIMSDVLELMNFCNSSNKKTGVITLYPP